MDCVPGKVMLSFTGLRSTVDDPKEPWQLLLRVVADFSLTIDGRPFYEESDFPVVEFASQVGKWLHRDNHDFLYVSMESAEDPLLAFYRLKDNQFRIYSPHQEFETTAKVDRQELCDALTSFNEELSRKVGSELGLMIDDLLL
jgi:hypothetical protein